MFRGPVSALAYSVQDLPVVEDKGDFVLGPGKTELFMNPGEKLTKELMITNRLGKDMDFKIDIEDLGGTKSVDEPVKLLGSDKGPYSLKDYLRPEVTEFHLKHGQRIFFNVEVEIPEDAEPGGLYGAVLVSTNPSEIKGEGQETTVVGARVVTRLGTLFFVRVKGDVIEEGFLKYFRFSGTARKIYEKGPVAFEIIMENTGTTHISPYGTIELTNIFGKKIAEIEVDPFFVMPDSVRLREMKWSRPFLFGRYVASVGINRGYDDIIDEKSLTFWVIPWKIVLAGIAILGLLAYLVIWFGSKFELRRKI